MTFTQLNLIEPLLRAVREAGYETPSPIQQKAIPPVLEGRDLLGCAQTGTGKTAAFALPILQRLAQSPVKSNKIRALILTPTRELALQIDESFAAYGAYLPVRHTVIFGGVGQMPQVAALKRGVEVLTACPGRLNDLIGQGHVDLSALEVFVLDEADRMLDMGFIHDVKKVIRQLPKQRQTLLFSATMPAEIERLAASILHKPVSVKVDPVSSTVDRIDQYLFHVEKADKPALLTQLVQRPEVTSALVFSRTKHGADKIARILNKNGVTAAAIHGNKSQSARVAALDGFKKGSTRVLVATDIAARGIDINELSHVFNYDLPEVPETYVHRIGRTGRAGQGGVAISFCSSEQEEYLAGIEKLNRRAIPVLTSPEELDAPPARKPEQTRKGDRSPMPENQRESNENQPLSASAKRRRRRRRAQSRAAAESEQAARGQESAAPAPAKQQAPKAAAQAPARGRQNGAKAPAQPQSGKPARGERSASAKPAAKPQPSHGEKSAAKPAQTPPRGKAKAAARDEDPGLLLISRRPPQQKFQSFEEYLASHGGASAPIEGGDEE